MAKLKINVFALGNPRDINTWSNVPYFVCSSLEKHGVEVRGFNLFPQQWLSYCLYRLLMKYWYKLVGRFSHFGPWQFMFRSRLNYFFANRNIRKLCLQYHDADANLFLTFSFSSFKHVPTSVIHYCDRAYEQLLDEIGRRPTRTDRFFIETERENIQHAALVLGLNEACCAYIRSRYRTENVHRLRPGINLETFDKQDPEALITLKEQRKDILFIGRNAHQRGADILIQAFRIFNAANENAFKLHIVGIARQELADWDEKIEIYPYLRKDDPKELAIYTELLASARLFVMPMRWGPLPGVIREAHRACTPVIITKISNSGARVTNEADGILVDSLKPEDFAFQMNRLVRDRDLWREMAMQARRAENGISWDNTAQELIRMLEDTGIAGPIPLAQRTTCKV
jgi:glycosyltransferase involved in cell wall biosynthesis